MNNFMETDKPAGGASGRSGPQVAATHKTKASEDRRGIFSRRLTGILETKPFDAKISHDLDTSNDLLPKSTVYLC